MLAPLLYFLSLFILIVTFIPFIRSDYWAFRVFDYPRLQKWFINLAVLLAFSFIVNFEHWYDWALLGGLIANFLYLSYLIYPFLPIAPTEVKLATPQSSGSRFSLMISNVLEDNPHKDRLLTLIRERMPDLLVLSETGHVWAGAMHAIDAEYPYRAAKVLDNTYGIMLFSRLEILESEIRFLVEDDVPSIFAKIRLADGGTFQLICIHPTPPVPGENTRSTERDKEILMVGKIAKESALPVIVTGDLNDVAWSYTNDLFQRTSGLLDPRKGRGFFNTFHAEHRFMRYPLDHIFCSPHFQLVHLERLPYIGSDHFPMWVELAYEPTEASQQRQPAADQETEAEAQKKMAKPTR